MRISVEVLIGSVVIVAAALAAFAAYRWQQRRRAHGVAGRVKDLLLARYGEPPTHLTIHCTDDRLWPVLVGFKHPTAGARHRSREPLPTEAGIAPATCSRQACEKNADRHGFWGGLGGG